MALHYYCRHCHASLGTIQEQAVDSVQLGFAQLNDQERKEMIVYASSGDIHVNAICEDCHESLQKNPDLHENDYIIH